MTLRPQVSLATGVFAFALLTCASMPGVAQGAFVRNDAFDFNGVHQLQLGGPNINSVTANLVTAVDWRTFKINVKTGTQFPGFWFVNAVEIDWTGDGSWDVEVSNSGLHSHTYPQPGSSSGDVYTIRFRLKFSSTLGGQTPPEFRIVSTTIRVFPASRVYATPAGDALVQLRNEDCTTKIPVLMVEGIDVTNNTSADTYYALTQNLIDTLFGLGYEVFFLNFHDADRDLRDNAAVVRQALTAVHELCPDAEILLAGMSMGGLIGRWALAEAEQQGQPHHVGMFLSYDSPQQKAHANGALQDYIKLNPDNIPNIAVLQAKLQTQAAKQMLGYNTYDTDQSEHLEFYGQLRALNGDGYPDKSYNVAVSNGSMFGTWGYDQEDNLLLTLKMTDDDGGWVVESMQSGRKDVEAGSTQVNIAELHYGLIYASPWLTFVGAPNDLWWELEIHFNPVYIATASALDLQPPPGHADLIYDSDYNISAHGGSKFDDHFVQPSSVTTPRPRGLTHNAVSGGAHNAILNWLNRTSNVVVDYSLPDGGSIASETFPVQILRKIAIPIQPKTVTLADGRQVTYGFVSWDDGSTENPRTFAASHNVSRTAVMKAHLVTSVSGATATNGQRRIAEDWDAVGPTYHGVYESGGAIWYLRNRRGAGWEPERLLSTLGTAAGHPAVATRWWGHDDQIEVHTAWLPPGSIDFNFRSSNIDNGASWQAIRSLPLGCDPSVPLLPNTNSLVWAEGTGNGCEEFAGIYYYKLPSTNNTWWPHIVPGTAGNVSLPAVVASATSQYELAFVKDGKVYYVRFTDPNLLNPYAAPQASGSPVDLTTSGWTATNPAVAMNGANVLVAWEESNGSTTRIAFKERSSTGSWSGTSYFAHLGHTASKPVLGVDYACGSVKVLWECGDHVGRVSRAASGSAWGAVESVGAGRAPSIVAFGTYNATAMWTSGAAAPYALELNTTCADVVAPGLCELAPDLWLTNNGVGLEWTAPGDDGSVGTASEYDIRWRLSSQGALTETNWASSNPVAGEPTPASAGTSQTYFVGGLNANTWYYIGIRARDEMVNWGSICTVHIKTMAGGGGGGGASAQGNREEALSAVGMGGTPHLAIETSATDLAPTFRAYRLGTEESSAIALAESSAIVIQTASGASGWETVSRLRGVAGAVGLASRRLTSRRILFPGNYGLSSIASHASGLMGQPLELNSASNSRLGPLTVTDLAAPALEAGDIVTVQYRAAESAADGASDWCLLLGNVAAAQGTRSGKQAMSTPVPVSFALHQSHPNPFSRISTIRFDLPRESGVRIDVLDLQGRAVATLADQVLPAGQHVVTWDRRTRDGQLLPAGVYFCRMVAGKFRSERKMTALP